MRSLSDEILSSLEPGDHKRVGIYPRPIKIGEFHASTSDPDTPRVAAFVLGASRTRYLVMRQEDVWFITFNGEEFGPYRSEREAMLFATDAAHKLGELGEETQVFRVDENGAAAPVWTYGLDPYPPAS